MNDQRADVGRLGSGLSRREFLKGSGAAAGVASGAGLVEAQAPAGPRIGGPEKTKPELSVNGAAHSVQVEPRTTLLEALRYQLNLTGAKPVSDDGVSGASPV